MPDTGLLKVIPSNSFDFNAKNSLEAFGIKVIAYDQFSANKRDRAQTIAFRDGFYDYGDKNFDTKILTLDCCIERPMSKGERREVAYWLTSERGYLTLWDEPDKRYLGEILDAADVNVITKYIKQQFTLRFKCAPFAIGKQVIQPISSGLNAIKYGGTAKTPTLIVIKNTGTKNIVNIEITLTKRRRTLNY